MYYGWSGTIAVPAQVKYAHKIAYPLQPYQTNLRHRYYGGTVLNRKKPSDRLANNLYFL
jgi:hypothetical protein